MTTRADRVPRVAVVFTVVFLVLLVAPAVGEWNAWPFTGWQLFSHVRAADQSGWRATYVDDAGVERTIPFGSLPRSYHGSLGVLKSFSSFSAARRTAVCDAWASALRQRGQAVRAINLYRTHTHLRLGHQRAVRTRSSLAYSCAT